MGKVVINKGVVICYLVSMLLTYIVVIRVDSLNTDITSQEPVVVYEHKNITNH